MSEVIADLPYRIVNARGDEYYVSVAGEPRADGRWEAWLEYVPTDESDALLTSTETTQATRGDVVRWAETLTETYVQGAFERAVTGGVEPALPRMVARLTRAEAAAEAAIAASRGELPDPFELYASGRPAMRARLSVLSRAALLEIITTFGLNPAGKSLAWLSQLQLVTFIVTAVEVQVSSGRHPA